MRNVLLTLFLTVATIASADPRDWAKRIPCELQTAGIASLPALTLLQGSSPLIACDQYRSGKALTVTNDVQAVMRFSSSLTNTLWVSVTNQSYYSNSYLIQLPSLGTNAVNWVYTILYYKDGAIYWTGTGRLDIKATEVTGNALEFVEVQGCVTTNTINSAISTHNSDTASHPDKVSTSRTITVNGQTGTLSSNLVFSAISGLSESDVTNIAEAVIAPYTNAIETAWQNPASATNWTWTSDGKEITLTAYNFDTGGATVVIPDMLDGLPVTKLGGFLFSPDYAAMAITSVSGGNNVKTIGSSAFDTCLNLTSASLPSATTIGNYAFHSCTSLTSISFPSATTIGNYAFPSCTSLASVSLPNVTTIGGYAFYNCTSLTSVYWGQNQPTEPVNLYLYSQNVTNYVTNPTATGWGATFGGRPVVRMPTYADTFHPSTNYVSTGTEALGTVFWDTASQTLVVKYPNGQNLNLGEECVVPVQNDTGATITNGMTVMYVGSIGNSGNVRVAPAYVTASTDVHRILGMATTDIPNGEVGKVTVRGKVRGIQTNGANVGQTWTNTTEVYVTTNASLAGYCTSVKPDAPFPAIRIAKVTSAHASSGTFDVQVEMPNRLTDLVDVDGTPLTTSGQILVWDETRKVFDFNYNYHTGTNLLWQNFADYVPYTGATATVDIGTNNLIAGDVYISTNGTSITQWPAVETDPVYTADVTNGDIPASAVKGLESALLVATNRPSFQTYTGLTGSITLTNNLEAPISISGTGSISVAFAGLVPPYPVYFTAQGFDSLTFPSGSYLVGGGVWQTNRVNHFVVWQYSTNLYVNPVVTTEL